MDNLLADSRIESLSVVIIDVSNLQDFSQINEREFFYKGSLYDIKSKEIKDNKVIFHCKQDEKELNLLNHFSRMSDENKSNSSKNPLNRYLQKSSQNLFFTNPQLLGLLFPQSKLYCDLVIVRYEQPDAFQLTPPPQIYFS